MRLGLGLGISSNYNLESMIRSLFSSGEGGVWLDPSDMTTLYQDSAGTTPATTAGQPVGRIEDKSGNGNHAIQDVSTGYRPTLRQNGTTGAWYLEFDGVDDYLYVPTMDMSASDEVLIASGVRKISDGEIRMIYEHSTNANEAGNFGVFALFGTRSALTNDYEAWSRGTGPRQFMNAGGYVAPISNVIAHRFKIATDYQNLRIDGQEVGSASSDLGTGNLGNYPFYIGSRAETAFPFDGHIYGLIVSGALPTSGQLTSTELYLAQRTGTSL